MSGWKSGSALALAGLLVLYSGLMVRAEETEEPAGYHVYDVQENEVSDTWYGVGRGAYLRAGICKLTEGDSPDLALCSGHTLAHMDCDRVYVRIYLDESDTGTGGWTTLDYWTGERFNASMVSATSSPYKVTKDKYYRATGAHSATMGQGNDARTEATDTCTNALLFTW